MTIDDEGTLGPPGPPTEPPAPSAGGSEGGDEAKRRLSELTAAGEAAMAAIAEDLGTRAPPPASQSAHALWIGALVAILYLAGSRGLGADTPVISLVSVGVAGGLIFSLSWFQERAAERAHALGRKEMGRAIAQHLGERRLAEARGWLEGAGHRSAEDEAGGG